METFTFYKWWAEPVCSVEAPEDTPMEQLLIMARDKSNEKRIDYYRKKSERDRFEEFLDRCKAKCGGDDNWVLRLPRSHKKGQLTLADLNDMLQEITYIIPNKMREYPYVNDDCHHGHDTRTL
jgi:hypothetical protein